MVMMKDSVMMLLLLSLDSYLKILVLVVLQDWETVVESMNNPLNLDYSFVEMDELGKYQWLLLLGVRHLKETKKYLSLVLEKRTKQRRMKEFLGDFTWIEFRWFTSRWHRTDNS